jgi:hypothetical protein
MHSFNMHILNVIVTHCLKHIERQSLCLVYDKVKKFRVCSERSRLSQICR